MLIKGLSSKARRMCGVIGCGIVIGSLAFLICARASEQAAPEQGQVRALQAQVDDLSRELLLLHGAANAPARKQFMQDYWAMLQRQLQYVRRIPGVASRDCRDWTLLDPGVAGRGAAGSATPCPLMSHDMGPASGWEIPDNITPELFELMMQQQLQILRAQTDRIAAETDQAKRLDLIRALYETRYQDIQTVRGREWMWTAHAAASLPEGQSMGAELLGRYCSQCHTVPLPSLHTQAEWHGIAHHMRDIIQGEAGKQVSGIQLPTVDEFDLISMYLEMHGHAAP